MGQIVPDTYRLLSIETLLAKESPR